MSSRNAYLDPAARERAPPSSAPCWPRGGRPDGVARGRARSGPRRARAAGIEPDYLEARDPDDLSPATELNGRPVLVAVAARVGGTRLIDNIIVEP